MVQSREVIHSDPDILGGTTVVRWDSSASSGSPRLLEGGSATCRLPDDYPTVTHDQAIAVLEQAKDLLVS